MLGHYLKLALKRIVHHRLYSVICIASLAVGMTAAILILGFVRYESGFDAMHPQADRLYRLNWSVPRNNVRFATFFNPLTPILAQAVPDIEVFSRLAMREHVLRAGADDHYLRVSLVDDAFFEVFDYPSLSGDPDAAIRAVDGAVLTEAAARRLFGAADAVGEVFTVDGAFDFRVGAVVANNAANSHLGSNIFVNIERLPEIWNEPGIWSNFGSDRMYHYVRLAPGVTQQTAEANVKAFILENIDPQMAEVFLMQPLRDIHFTPDLQNEMSTVDDILGTVKPLRQRSDIALFSSVALLALLIAALNFMNMQAVQFSKRAREVGVRRLTGSSQRALAVQLISETALLSLCALLVALPLCELLMPWFASVLGLPPAAEDFLGWRDAALLALFALAMGVLTAVPPALGAARLPAHAALRGEPVQGASAGRLRAALIVVQFTISIGLIVGAFTVEKQLDYALSKPLGFDPRGVVLVDMPRENAGAALEVLRNRLQALDGVAALSWGSSAPSRSISDGFALLPEGGAEEDALLARSVYVGEGYFEALGMTMAAGRPLGPQDRKPGLSAERLQAQGGVVLNEAAARLAGWSDPAQALGARFVQPVQMSAGVGRNVFTVVGVAADAHYGSVRQAVEPAAYVFVENYPPQLMILKLAERGARTALAALDAAWREAVPAEPMRRAFLEQAYAALYAGEARTFALFIALATLAVLIACSGLYGLAIYNTERRVKEIGVRKVMGAGVWRIVLLLTNDFSRLVLVSNLIAWPLAWFAMQNWLAGFAYRIDLTPLVFVGSGCIAFCIAWVTVGGTAAKAANANPALALRHE